jgi:tetratricopeptide (TPR) repeat protein
MKRTLPALAVLAVAIAAVAVFASRHGRAQIEPGSREYAELTASFYRGLASLQVGLLEQARTAFQQATTFAPREPASWANLGLTALRLGDLTGAARPFAQAVALAPANSTIAMLEAQYEIAAGHVDRGLAGLRHAVELDPQNLRARYTLATEIEASGTTDSTARSQETIEQLLAIQPANLVLLLDRARLAAKHGDRSALQDSVDRLSMRTISWPGAAIAQSRVLEDAVKAGNLEDAARAVVVLRNVLLRDAAFRENLAALRTPPELIAEPFDRFLTLPPPSSMPSPADEGMTFAADALGSDRTTTFRTAFAVSLDGNASPAIFAADGRQLRGVTGSTATFSMSGAADAISQAAVLAVDWNRDFRQDFVIAGRDGVRLFIQDADGAFTDRTNEAGRLDPMRESAIGVWTADIEMDGDLDLIVATERAEPVVLRNNGDGTWRRLIMFPGVVGLRAFAWGDLDGDGDPDAVLLDADGRVHVFENRQAGEFRPIAPPPGLVRVTALAIGDANGDGALDLVTLESNGTVRRHSLVNGMWRQQPLAAWNDQPDGVSPGFARLLLADLDNNGAMDIVASAGGRTRAWLGGGGDTFHMLPSTMDADVFSVADVDGDGLLDLVGVSSGRPVRLKPAVTKHYRWQTIRPRAQQAAGDQRINAFGIGGEVELRAGLLVEKQIIADTSVHFGLGARDRVDVARIVWPNGVMQADFDLGADQTVTADQRLKGSCPWVFVDDGTGMRFVTDFLWRSPLGLRINAQDTAGVSQTEDWVRIAGDQLAPRDGAYDVRITAELWETHFIDHVALMAVDHPADLEMFVDERFAKDPPSLAVHLLKQPQPVRHAWDDGGRDVTDLVRQRDGRYLTTIARGVYQGVAADHFIELELDREVPAGQPLWLVANGWIYPTDSSINVAIGQGRLVTPRGLSLEAQDEHGRWIVVSPDLGFPAGKNKTILIDLTAVARAGLAHATRIRLRTNLEIYWDWIAVAEDAGRSSMEARRLAPSSADLRFRGFSRTSYNPQSTRAAPETPSYGELANVSTRWRDLEGYYTRFGDVRELLADVDDRYVIMNAGDELRLRFTALPAPRAGWRRDFVLIGDGWEKDGDFNTTFSETVLPLPSHQQPRYELGTVDDLEHDPVYRRHAADWQSYHTRFVTPRTFVDGLR